MKLKFLLFLVFCFCTLSAFAKDLRVVSLAPATTEILFALGLDKEIVGVSQFSDYPPQAAIKQSVGTFSDPNVEMILSLKPDIIFCTGLEQAPVVEKLRQLKLNIYVSNPADFKELFASIIKMGQLTGRDAAAYALVKKMSDTIERVKNESAGVLIVKRPKVYIEIWHSPLMTAAKGSFVDEMIYLAGGVNIAHNNFKPYVNFTTEEAIHANPDCIIMAYMDKQDAARLIASRPGWDGIAAVKLGHVYNDIDSDLFLRPGPRLIDGLSEIHKRLYGQ
jgi:iron complex transport system substrate-binding protein